MLKGNGAAQAGFRRAVVTGGAGFLGSHLCAELVATGTEVLCLDNLITGRVSNVDCLLENPLFRLVEYDVTAALDWVGYADLVIHMASPASPKDYQRMPIETMLASSRGCQHALDVAAEHDARFLLTSTSEVYGDPEVHPQREDYWGNVNPVGPRSVYDEGKRYAEALTVAYRRQRGVRTAIARIFNTYGPRMNPADGRMIPSFVCQALRGDPLTVTGSGKQTRSLCYVTDTLRGLLRLADASCAGPVNIGNPDEISVLEIATVVTELVGGEAPIEFVDEVVDDPRRRCPDIDRAYELLGWRPEVDMRAGLRATIDWFAAELGVPACRRV